MIIITQRLSSEVESMLQVIIYNISPTLCQWAWYKNSIEQILSKLKCPQIAQQSCIFLEQAMCINIISHFGCEASQHTSSSDYNAIKDAPLSRALDKETHFTSGEVTDKMWCVRMLGPLTAELPGGQIVKQHFVFFFSSSKTNFLFSIFLRCFIMQLESS